MKQRLYANRPNLTIGFHGCDQSVVDKVITGKENLLVSTNDYDWLGSGIYFWENNEERAYNWACELSKRSGSSIKSPAVIGAVIDLGYCFDLTDSTYLQELKDAYNFLVDYSKLTRSSITRKQEYRIFNRPASKKIRLYGHSDGSQNQT